MGVHLVKWVAVEAMSLPRVQGRRAVSAQGILAGCNQLDMRGVDTDAIAAKVVRLEPFRDGADQRFVCDPMGQGHHVRTNTELAIANSLF